MKRKIVKKIIPLLCAAALTCSQYSFVSAEGSPSAEKITSVVKEVEIKNEIGEVKKVEVYAENLTADFSNAKNEKEKMEIAKDVAEKAAAPVLDYIDNLVNDMGLKTDSKDVKQVKDTVVELYTKAVTAASQEEVQKFKEKAEKKGTFRDDTIVKTEDGKDNIIVKDEKGNNVETIEVEDKENDVQSVSDLFILKIREKTSDTSEEKESKDEGETVVLDDTFEFEVKLKDLPGVTEEEAEEEDVRYLVAVYTVEAYEENGEQCSKVVESFVNATIETVEVEPETETEKSEGQTEISEQDKPKEEKVLRAVLPPNAIAAEVKKVVTKKKSSSNKETSSAKNGKDKSDDKISKKKQKYCSKDGNIFLGLSHFVCLYCWSVVPSEGAAGKFP